MPSQLLLFVTGVPSKMSSQKLLGMFGKIGDFKMLCLKHSATEMEILKANPKMNLKRGFCLIEAQDTDSYRRALQAGNISHGKRSLKISKFKERNDLPDFLREEDFRSVIVNTIPKVIGQELVTKPLQAQFGEVKRIFRYVESQNSTRSSKKAGKFYTYSVEFDSIDAVYKATKAGRFQINGQDSHVVIERFRQKNYIKTNIRYSKTGSPSSPFSRSTYERSEELNQESYGQDSLIHHNLVVDPIQRVVPQLSVGKAYRFLHSSKPTCKAYYAFRDELRAEDPQSASYFLPATSQLNFHVNLTSFN